jgi:hypothetical protein
MIDSGASPYAWLVDNVAVIGSFHAEENELGAAAFATNAILSPLPVNGAKAFRLLKRTHQLGPTSTSIFRRRPEDIDQICRFQKPVVLHEGYRVSPSLEYGDQIEALRSVLGPRLRASPPDVWLRWGSKPSFRRICAELLGENTVPPGAVFETGVEDADLAAFARSLGARQFPRIVKLPGSGGSGNTVIPADQTFDPRLLRTALVSRTNSSDAISIVVEDWVPWRVSLSVSYLIDPILGNVFLAACEQIVDRKKAKFIGSKSSSGLSAEDTRHVVGLVSSLTSAIAADGYVGVVAFDLIVGDWQGTVGHRLPSGERACVIECNPRMNRHNRIGLLVERIARTWSVRADRLEWKLKDVSSSGALQPDGLTDAKLPEHPRNPENPVRMDLTDGDRLMRLWIACNRESGF